MVFGDIIPYSLADMYQHSRGNCCLHLQVGRLQDGNIKTLVLHGIISPKTAVLLKCYSDNIVALSTERINMVCFVSSYMWLLFNPGLIRLNNLHMTDTGHQKLD
jgi:hypothetical protein